MVLALFIVFVLVLFAMEGKEYEIICCGQDECDKSKELIACDAGKICINWIHDVHLPNEQQLEFEAVGGTAFTWYCPDHEYLSKNYDAMQVDYGGIAGHKRKTPSNDDHDDDAPSKKISNITKPKERVDFIASNSSPTFHGLADFLKTCDDAEDERESDLDIFPSETTTTTLPKKPGRILLTDAVGDTEEEEEENEDDDLIILNKKNGKRILKEIDIEGDDESDGYSQDMDLNRFNDEYNADNENKEDDDDQDVIDEIKEEELAKKRGRYPLRSRGILSDDTISNTTTNSSNNSNHTFSGNYVNNANYGNYGNYANQPQTYTNQANLIQSNKTPTFESNPNIYSNDLCDSSNNFGGGGGEGLAGSGNNNYGVGGGGGMHYAPLDLSKKIQDLKLYCSGDRKCGIKQIGNLPDFTEIKTDTDTKDLLFAFTRKDFYSDFITRSIVRWGQCTNQAKGHIKKQFAASGINLGAVRKHRHWEWREIELLASEPKYTLFTKSTQKQPIIQGVPPPPTVPLPPTTETLPPPPPPPPPPYPPTTPTTTTRIPKPHQHDRFREMAYSGPRKVGDIDIKTYGIKCNNALVKYVNEPNHIQRLLEEFTELRLVSLKAYGGKSAVGQCYAIAVVSNLLYLVWIIAVNVVFYNQKPLRITFIPEGLESSAVHTRTAQVSNSINRIEHHDDIIPINGAMSMKIWGKLSGGYRLHQHTSSQVYDLNEVQSLTMTAAQKKIASLNKKIKGKATRKQEMELLIEPIKEMVNIEKMKYLREIQREENKDNDNNNNTSSITVGNGMCDDTEMYIFEMAIGFRGDPHKCHVINYIINNVSKQKERQLIYHNVKMMRESKLILNKCIPDIFYQQCESMAVQCAKFKTYLEALNKKQ